MERLLDYRFSTTSDLDGHTVGNLLLTAMSNITGNMSDGIAAIGKVLNLKGKVLPLTEDNVILMAKMKDGTIVEGEHNITGANNKIDEVYYKEKPVVDEETLKSIRSADCIVLSMGSLYTSIIPNLLCDEVIEEIDKSKAKLVYVCNMMTQPGETDEFNVSDHIKILNNYLGKRKIDVVIANDGKINKMIIDKYASLEQKDPVLCDRKELKTLGVRVISDDFVSIEQEMIRHDTLKLAFHIFSLLIRG